MKNRNLFLSLFFLFVFDAVAVNSTVFILITLISFSIYIIQRYFKFPASKKRIAVLGNNDTGKKLATYFQKNKRSFILKGHYEDLAAIHTFKAEDQIDEVYSTIFPEEAEEILPLISFAEQHCVRLKYVTSFSKYKHEKEIFTHLNYNLNRYCEGFPILVTRQEPLSSTFNRIVKRGFDIIFSLLVIACLLSWLLPLLSIIILLESPGSPIFSQLRSGKKNKEFWCYKFRSMRVNKKSDHVQATKCDARLTKIGAFIRKTSIDELPQFFNVLMGDMSVVGPRPHMLRHTEQYRLIIEQYMIRHFLKPGITGWAQINGHRGETKETHQMRNRVEHDLWYLENWTLAQDFRIIHKTLVNAIKGEDNAY